MEDQLSVLPSSVRLSLYRRRSPLIVAHEYPQPEIFIQICLKRAGEARVYRAQPLFVAATTGNQRTSAIEVVNSNQSPFVRRGLIPN